MKRASKHITDPKDVEFILSLNEDNITKSVLMDMFGEFDDKRRFHTYDTIEIPPNTYGNEKKNKNTFTTTIGIWVFNRFLIESMSSEFGYINKNCSQDTYDDINKKLSFAVLEDRLPAEAIETFNTKCQFLQQFSTVLCSSYSEKMLTCTTVFNKKKAELTKKYAKEIAEGDPIIAAKIEKELIDFAKEYLKDDPAMDMFMSGARESFGNQFKNMFLMKGAIKSPDPNGGYKISLDNYMDGISKEDYVTIADALAEGPYARANKTMIGGYWEKLFVSAFQHVTLGPKGSDCGTNRTITITLNKNNINGFLYSYMVEGSKLVELNSTNMDKYIGKTVKFRFASLCEDEHICNTCAGNMFYKLGITNVGIVTPELPSIIKNLSMKSFHNSVVSIAEMDPEKAFNT